MNKVNGLIDARFAFTYDKLSNAGTQINLKRYMKEHLFRNNPLILSETVLIFLRPDKVLDYSLNQKNNRMSFGFFL